MTYMFGYVQRSKSWNPSATPCDGYNDADSAMQDAACLKTMKGHRKFLATMCSPETAAANWTVVARVVVFPWTDFVRALDLAVDWFVLDVEGGEAAVLRGMNLTHPETDSSHPSLMQVEGGFHGLSTRSLDLHYQPLRQVASDTFYLHRRHAERVAGAREKN